MNRTSLLPVDKFFDQVIDNFNQFGVGFDSVIDGFRTIVETSNNYPPYNVEQLNDNKYRVTLALAGFTRKDINVTKEGNWLIITGKIENKVNNTEKDNDEVIQYLHRGIASRSFEKRIQLAPDIEVSEASMNNGLLQIELVRIIPEHMKPKIIKIK